ncbi:putative uncharacterized protein DDB_G0286901 [Anastrepha obliqua]|uniref:putative uncharacterized protein DDB_G0286901 n=1 Tax=Anastrepha obliqua TaxID=95512 RepID=UPI002409E910|nr:putative uncharacterized protein DDB_G0286901 [Anastrepha obliqua]
MASEMENFLEMSLDEYIATKKSGFRKIGNSSGGAVSKPSDHTSPVFKDERRNSNEVNEELNEDKLMDSDLEPLGERSLLNSSGKLNKSFGIWRGPSAEKNFIDLDYMKDEFDEMFNDPELQKSCKDKQLNPQQQIDKTDLRERLNNSINANNNCSSINKQQQPFVQPAKKSNNRDTNAKLRSNMQTQQNSMSLTSLNSDGSFSSNGQNRRRWNGKRNFRRRNNDGCGNSGNGFVNNSGQNLNRYNNNRNGGGCAGVYNNNNISMNNNGRIQRFNQRNNQDSLNKRIKTVLDQINGTNSIYVNKQVGSVRDLTIECPSVSFPGRLTTGAVQTVAQQTLQSQATQTQNELKALLGVNESNLKGDTMAMLAGKLLDLFQSSQQQTIHKPIYDMQIQKEIHELQGKSLLYKCPSGEVVSSDGTGIDNCKITPSSSGVTLNYRFG